MTVKSKKHLKQAAIAMSAVALVGSSGCSVVNRVSKQLEGEWDITSWVQDGYDYMTYYQSASLDFGAAEDGEGDFDWNWTDGAGDSYTIEGEFELNDDATEIDLDGALNIGTYSIPAIASFDLEIDGDDLELDGNVNNYSTTIQAERQ